MGTCLVCGGVDIGWRGEDALREVEVIMKEMWEPRNVRAYLQANP